MPLPLDNALGFTIQRLSVLLSLIFVALFLNQLRKSLNSFGKTKVSGIIPYSFFPNLFCIISTLLARLFFLVISQDAGK